MHGILVLELSKAGVLGHSVVVIPPDHGGLGCRIVDPIGAVDPVGFAQVNQACGVRALLIGKQISGPGKEQATRTVRHIRPPVGAHGEDTVGPIPHHENRGILQAARVVPGVLVDGLRGVTQREEDAIVAVVGLVPPRGFVLEGQMHAVRDIAVVGCIRRGRITVVGKEGAGLRLGKDFHLEVFDNRFGNSRSGDCGSDPSRDRLVASYGNQSPILDGDAGSGLKLQGRMIRSHRKLGARGDQGRDDVTVSRLLQPFGLGLRARFDSDAVALAAGQSTHCGGSRHGYRLILSAGGRLVDHTRISDDRRIR